jgi:hypothetical protein
VNTPFADVRVGLARSIAVSQVAIVYAAGLNAAADQGTIASQCVAASEDRVFVLEAAIAAVACD